VGKSGVCRLLAPLCIAAIAFPRRSSATPYGSISGFPSKWLHSAYEQPADARISYRFHPRFGEVVQIRRRLEAGGVEFVVLLQPDGTSACLPAWMTEAAASRFTIGDEAHFPLEILRAMRAEVDALLGPPPVLVDYCGSAQAAEDASAAREISVLQTNFRNTQAVTGLANRLLRIKQARFGSVDRESNFLVRCASGAAGAAQLLKSDDKILRALNATSRASVRYAVIVLRDEDKAAARAHFATPLIFSVHEAKGLEYPSVILFQTISANRGPYAEVCRDVAPGDLEGEELDFRRARDKTDKSLEIF
jgi:hypothetical protein